MSAPFLRWSENGPHRVSGLIWAACVHRAGLGEKKASNKYHNFIVDNYTTMVQLWHKHTHTRGKHRTLHAPLLPLLDQIDGEMIVSRAHSSSIIQRQQKADNLVLSRVWKVKTIRATKHRCNLAERADTITWLAWAMSIVCGKTVAGPFPNRFYSVSLVFFSCFLGLMSSKSSALL